MEKKTIFIHVAGNTLDSHKAFVKELTERGAKKVDAPRAGVVSIVFCPIASRYESDVHSALSSATEQGCEEVILVAMHHTFNKDYVLPNQRESSNPGVKLVVDCLFFEEKGFFACPRNKTAVKMVRDKLGLKKRSGCLGKGKQKTGSKSQK